MTPLEKQFTQEVLKNYQELVGKCAFNPTKLIQTIEKFGGVKTIKEIIRKGRVSDGFEKLQEAGQLKSSLEASVVKAQYGELFTDDEVNSCYEVLCEYEYFC